MRKAGKIPPRSKPSFAIVVEGKTEEWYLQMLN